VEDRREVVRGQPVAEARPEVVESTVPRVRKLYAARHLPATELAKSMSVLFSNARNELFIAPEPITNQLLINGQPEQVEELLQMLALIDRQPKTVAIDIWILEINSAPEGAAEIAFADTVAKLKPQLQDLEKAHRLTVADHIQLGGIENQKLSFQQGENRRVVTGSQGSPSGPFRAMSTSSLNMGTIATATARVTDENEIVADLKVEKSYPGRVEDGVVVSTNSKGEDVRSPHSHTTTCQSTVNFHSGQVITLGGLSSSGGKENVRILAAASLVDEK
jgi:type II secretory pathway component GspD/PulD (secretin)